MTFTFIGAIAAASASLRPNYRISDSSSHWETGKARPTNDEIVGFEEPFLCRFQPCRIWEFNVGGVKQP